MSKQNQNNQDKLSLSSLSQDLFDTMIDVATDYGQLALNRLGSFLSGKTSIEPEFLKIAEEIPFLKTILAVGKVGVFMKDIVFLKKIERFLSCYEETTQKEREKFTKKIQSLSKEKKESVGESIILSLERFDQLEKAEGLAKIFVAYLDGKIDIKELGNYQYVLTNINLKDIESLVKCYRKQKVDRSSLMNFLATGLLEISMALGNDNLVTNEFGEKFLTILDIKYTDSSE